MRRGDFLKRVLILIAAAIILAWLVSLFKLLVPALWMSP